MAKIKPFRALRPARDKAKQVSCVPYDVIDEDEVRERVRNNPLSFLRVTRPEAELGEEVTHDAAFQKAKETLEDLVNDGVFIRDDEPSFYIYRLASDTHRQTGIVACASLDEYESGVIRKHENVRPDKVQDRTRHMVKLRAQTGLIFLAFRDTEKTRGIIESATSADPLYDFHCRDNVRHTIWKIGQSQELTQAFAELPALYVADGHHRIESASRARQILSEPDPDSGDNGRDFVMAGIFPSSELRILAYNRVVHDLAGLTDEEFLDKLRDNFIVAETNEKEPECRGEFCMYLGGKWYKLRFNVQYYREPDVIERLDVSILQNHILEPILRIRDPRTDERIGFVGGGRGTAELERLVDAGKTAVAFSLFPTSMDDLLEVSDRNEVMPPKSTWFEPKLKDGLLVHPI